MEPEEDLDPPQCCNGSASVISFSRSHDSTLERKYMTVRPTRTHFGPIRSPRQSRSLRTLQSGSSRASCSSLRKESLNRGLGGSAEGLLVDMGLPHMKRL